MIGAADLSRTRRRLRSSHTKRQSDGLDENIDDLETGYHLGLPERVWTKPIARLEPHTHARDTRTPPCLGIGKALTELYISHILGLADVNKYSTHS